jgi:hypothetical protein
MRRTKSLPVPNHLLAESPQTGLFRDWQDIHSIHLELKIKYLSQIGYSPLAQTHLQGNAD